MTPLSPKAVTPRRGAPRPSSVGRRLTRWGRRRAEVLFSASLQKQMLLLLAATLGLSAVYPLLLHGLGLLPMVSWRALGLLVGLFTAYGALALGLPEMARRLTPATGIWLAGVMGLLAGLDPLAWRLPLWVGVGWTAFLLPQFLPAVFFAAVALATFSGWWFSPGESFLSQLLAETALSLPLLMIAPFRRTLLVGAGGGQERGKKLEELTGLEAMKSQMNGYRESLRLAQDVQGMYRVLLDQLDSLIGKKAPSEVGRRLVRTAGHFLSADEVYLFIRYPDITQKDIFFQGWKLSAQGGEIRDQALSEDSPLRSLLEKPLTRQAHTDPAAAGLPLCLLPHRLVLIEPFLAQDTDLRGFYALGWLKGAKPPPHERQMLAHLAVLTATALESTLLRARLLAEARTDALTSLLNRRAFDEVTQREIRLSQRTGSPLALCMADVDHFKRVNDTHGHAVGDMVLKEVGALLLRELRGTDIVSRFGGEEFVAVLPSTPGETARVMAERLREKLSEIPFVNDQGETFYVTASFGVAAREPHQSLEQWLAAADGALYAAKQAGRNRVLCAQAPQATTPEGEQHTA